MPTSSHVEQYVIKQKKKSMKKHLKEHVRNKAISRERIIVNQNRVIDTLREENTQLKLKLYKNETFAKTLEEKIIRARYILFND
tara:strand:+ start:20 stop:271 length:252 start_codon:yes stop_codon:yes gene_type:complete